MQLSSTPISPSDFVEFVDAFVASHDVLTMAGSDAAALLRTVTPALRKASYFSASLGARAIECNQHNVDGARSGAAWLASILGVSERSAVLLLSALHSFELNPDVGDAAELGELSFEKAALVARMAKNRVSVTEELMSNASSDSYESLKRRGHDLNAKDETSDEQQTRLRDSQYVSVRHGADNMVTTTIRELPEMAGRWLSRWNTLEEAAVRNSDGSLPRSVVAAEAFSAMLAQCAQDGGGSSKAVVNYHVRLEDWRDGWPVEPKTCELAGVGLVPYTALAKLGEDVAIRLLIKSRNKLLWFSESSYTPNGELPEFVKRAVKANQFNQCATRGCTASADQVDHKLARTNCGKNEQGNLQGLCWACHAAKTKKDAPWTAGGIYGRPKQTGPPLADTG